MRPEKKYMLRALQLAKYGAGFVSPNPMVGAVIVAPDGRIIGEGWHRKFGGPHAEVNAIASVKPEDEHLLQESTIYVTLEPCSHYGKTPPCSLLLINKGLKRVVIGSPDPFPLVAGRGVKMLREAGIEVIEGFLQEECDFLNRRFITAHTLQRPYILLKWAQSADGFIAALSPEKKERQGSIKLDGKESEEYFQNNVRCWCATSPVQFSGPLSSALMHSERALSDAVLIGVNTVIIDNPSLTTRYWPGRSPRPVTFRSSRLPLEAKIMKAKMDGQEAPKPDVILLDPRKSLAESMQELYSRHGITSLMVEGGADTLRRFLDDGLFDAIRIEIAPLSLGTGLPAPTIPDSLIPHLLTSNS